MKQEQQTVEHESKQVAWWAFAIAAILAAAGIWLSIAYALAARPEAIVGVIIVLVAFLLSNFAVLTVRVTDREVRWFFGRGLIRKSVSFDRIQGVEVHRSPWYWGWGIRWTPRGWLWRSHGLNAVWLELSSGKQIGVGAADPEDLARAVRSHLGQTP